MAQSPSVTVRCPAKLNLFLEVLRRRKDGYHDIETVMVPAPFAEDVLTATATARPGVTLSLKSPKSWKVPVGPQNLASRAARLVLHDAKAARGVRLRLEKRIPPGAGLGGGSSDAAGALLAVNTLLGRPLARDDLHGLALALGSDVPFFLDGVAAVALGRGEVLSLLPEPPGRRSPRCVVLFPGVGVETAEVYGRCRPPHASERRHSEEVVAAWLDSDPGRLNDACFNRLEEPSREICPAVGKALSRLAALGRGTPHVTGSGSACFLFLERPLPPAAASRLRQGMPGALVLA